MPTILYQSKPLIFLRTKKTGSHSVKHCMRQYAEQNSVSFLEVRSKDTDTLENSKFVSHMPAKYLKQRIDVWDDAYIFTFVRNPWKCLKSYYYFCKYSGPKYNWNNPDNYNLDNIENFVKSMIDIKGTCNFNREIYSINDCVVANVYDTNEMSSVIKNLFNITEVPRLCVQEYVQEHISLPSILDNYIYRDYKWEIERFGYEKPTVD